MSPESSQTCGCKGVRFCSGCLDTDRVKRLRAEGDPYKDYSVYVYSVPNGCAVRCNQLSSSASLEEIENATSKIASEDAKETLTVDGLLLIPDFLSIEEEEKLVETIDKKEWVLSQSGRRKQDYGPQVNFKHKKVKTTRFVGMPDYADLILNKMSDFSIVRLGSYQPFELCNLEYNDERMSAIEMHQDDMWIWGNRLISINLINGSVMTLVNESTRQLLYVLMPRRSLLCMADEARYQWKHGVYSKHIHGRRIALTMREPAPAFQEGGDLYEKFGKELIRLGNIRITCS
ncbi:hypothetical protein QR680_015145 [Steinernema hermaphroditum]|uniref:Fe2OG dioxygenase domain-containing protein n=1 Tax=Steinernema hermaphroditum TaxID=289476 RepID=A0AA39M588_9BILA|nr:hypothetical protein QR680_015145 [Steinernema hermaphroditum]